MIVKNNKIWMKVIYQINNKQINNKQINSKPYKNQKLMKIKKI